MGGHGHIAKRFGRLVRRAARWWMPRFGIDYATLRSKFPALTLCGGVIGRTKRQPLDDVSIGKFDILGTYTYAQCLLDGLNDDEAKQRGMVAAIMGAQARLGNPQGAPRGVPGSEGSCREEEKDDHHRRVVRQAGCP